MLKRDGYWAGRQRAALEDVDPPLSKLQIANTMNEVSVHFKKVLAYLQAKNDPQAKVTVRRLSGFRHTMIVEDSVGELSNRHGFSNLVFVFGSGKNIPPVVLPKKPNTGRKKRNDSIYAQYLANPSTFKYYDKFGIFEVYDK